MKVCNAKFGQFGHLKKGRLRLGLRRCVDPNGKKPTRAR